MNLDYVIRKCKGFGYYKNFKTVNLKLSDIDDYEKYYIHVGEDVDGYININDLDKFYEDINKNVYENKKSLFVVELGKRELVVGKKDVEIDKEKIHSIIDEHEIELDITDDIKNKYKECLKQIIETPVNYINVKFNPTFIEYLKQMYMKFDDTKVQKTIIKILTYNGIRTDTLISAHPINFEPVEEKITKQSVLFSDLKINDPYFDENNNDEIEPNDILRRATTSKISQFNGFGNTFSKVDNSKTCINVQNNIPMRNYEVINMLTRNKIVSEPITMKRLSISTLMKCLSYFNDFKVVFIWPEFQGYVFSNTLSNILEITAPGCVILNVVFRYMCINFFGMYATYNDEDKYNKYLV